ncbi:hypothetical protein COBT_003003 [Conglomerata obtusa]
MKIALMDKGKDIVNPKTNNCVTNTITTAEQKNNQSFLQKTETDTELLQNISSFLNDYTFLPMNKIININHLIEKGMAFVYLFFADMYTFMSSLYNRIQNLEKLKEHAKQFIEKYNSIMSNHNKNLDSINYFNFPNILNRIS